MAVREMSILGVVAAASVCAAAIAETPAPVTPRRPAPTLWGDDSGLFSGQIDPLRFFDDLVVRYRCLTVYSDLVHVVRVTERYGQQPRREETELSCEIVEGELRVRTPGTQILESLGLNLPLKTGEAVEDARRQRDLKLAPHLALKFAEEPLDGMQGSGAETLTPTDAAPVRVNDRTLVQLQLRSGDGLSENCEAKYDLLVDPDSMLIERITGEARLPDGATQQTTMEIRPVQVECDAPPPPPPPPAADSKPPAGDSPPPPATTIPPPPPQRPPGAMGSVG